MKVRRGTVFAWALYDLGNTAFSMGIVSLYFPLWVRDHVGPERADTHFTILVAISMGAIFLISPTLGAFSDMARRRMPFLIASTGICLALTAVLGRLPFFWGAVAFMVANIAYQAGLQFYDSLLPNVSTPSNRGRVGGVGVALGYLGAYLAVGISFFVGIENKAQLFLWIAIIFLAFSLPCFLFVREKENPHTQKLSLRKIPIVFRQTLKTLRDTKRYPGLLRFLVGRVFYTDAINTVIAVMSLYTVNVAMGSGVAKPEAEVIARKIMMFAITAAVLGGFVWGWLADKFGPKRTLLSVLRSWMAVFCLAAAIGIFDLPLGVLYVVAIGAGFSLGGIWSSDRPLMLSLSPPERIGEFYGLYGMVGRFAAVIGPGIWALIFFIAVHKFFLIPKVAQGIGILVLLGMVVISFLILRHLPENGDNEAQKNGDSPHLGKWGQSPT